MKIKTILSQHRRDFQAIYECEHCNTTEQGYGYDDTNFHINVIPNMKCKSCGQSSPEDYRAMTTKYADNITV